MLVIQENMHEIAIANRVVQEVQQQKEDVTRVEVVVGELADIKPEELKEAMNDLVDWQVEVLFERSKVACEKCGYEGPANILDKGHGYCLFNCPDCESKPEVVEGGVIYIRGIE